MARAAASGKGLPMEILIFAIITVCFLGALIAAAFLSREKPGQPADLATGNHQARIEMTPSHDPDEWTKKQ